LEPLFLLIKNTLKRNQRSDGTALLNAASLLQMSQSAEGAHSETQTHFGFAKKTLFEFAIFQTLL